MSGKNKKLFYDVGKVILVVACSFLCFRSFKLFSAMEPPQANKINPEKYQQLAASIKPPTSELSSVHESMRMMFMRTWMQSIWGPDFNQDFQKLDISIPKEEMLALHKKYNIIMNRKPSNNILIIGCGNMKGETEYETEHRHIGCDTIDANWTNNPTVVGIFGDSDFSEAFGGNKYDKIIAEHMAPINYLPYTRKMLLNLLSENGIFSLGDEENSITRQKLATCTFFEFVKMDYVDQPETIVTEEADGSVRIVEGEQVKTGKEALD
jgi:hypothetical protein